MSRLAIGVILLANINPNAYASHLACVLRTAKEHPDYEFVFMGPQRLAIDTARNMMLEEAIRHDCEFLFQYDDDTLLHPDTINRLMERMKEDETLIAIQPLYYVRGWPYSLMAFKKNDVGNLEELSDIDVEGKDVVYCDAIGDGCSLIRVSHAKRLPGPKWFKTGDHHTEDIYFYTKVKNFLPECRIAVDCTFSCGHQLGIGSIDHTNVAWRRKIYQLTATRAICPDVEKRLDNLLAKDEVDASRVTPQLIYNFDSSFSRA